MSQLRSTVGRGHWLDLASGLSLSRHPEDAVVEQDAVVWEFAASAVQRLFESHPGLAPALAACLGGQVHQLIAGTRELMTKDVQARCATWLLQQAAPDRDEGRGGAAVLRLQQRKRAIALQLGTTAETFSRTLRDLSRHGLIDVKGYSIELLDIEGLRGIAGTAQR
jgi:CRP-like cAMP-binding protein